MDSTAVAISIVLYSAGRSGKVRSLLLQSSALYWPVWLQLYAKETAF
jgi:hypothetical protein